MSSGAIRAGRAFVEIFAKDKASQVFDRIDARMQTFGRGVMVTGGLIGGLGTAVAGFGVGAVAALYSMAEGFGSAGAAIDDMSQRTGLGADEVSRLAYSAGMAGSDVETLEKGVQAMSKKFDAAMNGSKSAAESFDKLGISLEDFNKMSQNDRFLAVADGLSKIEDPAERSALAMQVLGKSGSQLLPMFAGGAEGLRAMGREADDLGLVFSPEDAANAAEFDDALDRLGRTLGAIPNVIGSAVAPAITSMLGPITQAVGWGVQWIRSNKELVVTIAKVAIGAMLVGGVLIGIGAAVVAVGAVFASFGTILGFVGAAFAIVLKIVFFMLSPVGLLVAAVVALGAYLIYASGAGAKALAWLGQKFASLKDDAIKSWGAIGKALAAGDIALAGRVLWLLLKMEWQRGIAFLWGLWADLKNGFLSITNAMTYGAAKMFFSAVGGISKAWIETVDFLSDSWALFTNMLKTSWSSSIGFIEKVWTRLKAMFTDIDVDAEVNRIDTETKKANEANDQAMYEGIASREKQRNERKSKIDSDNASIQQTLDAMAAAEKAAREAKTDRDRQAAQAEVNAARAQWEAAIKQANDLPEQPAQDAGGDAGKSFEDMMKEAELAMQNANDVETQIPDVEGMLGDLAQVPDGAQLESGPYSQSDKGGTFSTYAAALMGGSGGVMDRVAKATEKSKESLERIDKNLADAKLVEQNLFVA